MKFSPLRIPDILVFEPEIFEDRRGFFFESFNEIEFTKAIGKKVNFIQDNHSKSIKGVFRGLHYQLPPMAQGKLIRVVQGEIYDVAVDLRLSSATFGQWVSEVLSAENKKQMWIPEGFAHGFLTISDTSEVLYKASNLYSPAHEQCLIWNDSKVNVKWPNENNFIVSDKDSGGLSFSNLILFK